MRNFFDCEGHNVDCKTRGKPVLANPDIAGIGVIVGFLSTTCIAILIAFSVLFLDRYEKTINLFRKVFTKNKTEYVHDLQGPYWRSPVFWSHVLSKNLIAFSDTQLVTGLAVQFTALLQHCELSIYHFRVITELAFMTTITHLLAVITLRDYFVKNRWINLPRIIFMLANLGMLGYTSFVSYSYDIAGLDVSSSLACFFQGERPPLKAAFGGKWAALLIGAIGGHATVIAAMYILPEEKLEDGQWTYKWLGAILRTWLIAPAYTIYGVIIAGQTLTETQALGNSSVNITGSETAWGFGQFLPILLLALPIFAGWETFWEEKDEDRDNRFGKKTLWNHRKSRSDLEGAGKEKRPDLEQRDNSGLEIAIESDGSNLSSDRTLRPALDPHTAPIPSPRLSIPSPAASPPLPSQRRAP